LTSIWREHENILSACAIVLAAAMFHRHHVVDSIDDVPSFNCPMDQNVVVVAGAGAGWSTVIYSFL
jgi:hypothetical protein